MQVYENKEIICSNPLQVNKKMKKNEKINIFLPWNNNQKRGIFFFRRSKKSRVNFPKVWIYFPVVLTWAVSWWWWLQCWKRIASLCTECRVQQDCTVHRVPKCLNNVQKLCTPVALRSFIEHSVWYRAMLCTFSIAIIIINGQIKSK